MKHKYICTIIPGLVAALLVIICCGSKEDTTEPEPWTSFIGSWTAEKKYDQDGDQIKEYTNIIFYTSFRYRWTHNHFVNNEKDESNSYVELGDYEVTEIDLTFTPEEDPVRTYSYNFPSQGVIILTIDDGQGNVLDFFEHEKSRWQTY